MRPVTITRDPQGRPERARHAATGATWDASSGVPLKTWAHAQARLARAAAGELEADSDQPSTNPGGTT